MCVCVCVCVRARARACMCVCSQVKDVQVSVDSAAWVVLASTCSAAVKMTLLTKHEQREAKIWDVASRQEIDDAARSGAKVRHRVDKRLCVCVCVCVCARAHASVRLRACDAYTHAHILGARGVGQTQRRTSPRGSACEWQRRRCGAAAVMGRGACVGLLDDSVT